MSVFDKASAAIDKANVAIIDALNGRAGGIANAAIKGAKVGLDVAEMTGHNVESLTTLADIADMQLSNIRGEANSLPAHYGASLGPAESITEFVDALNGIGTDAVVDGPIVDFGSINDSIHEGTPITVYADGLSYDVDSAIEAADSVDAGAYTAQDSVDVNSSAASNYINTGISAAFDYVDTGVSVSFDYVDTGASAMSDYIDATDVDVVSSEAFDSDGGFDLADDAFSAEGDCSANADCEV